jgi:hypothetical protein
MRAVLEAQAPQVRGPNARGGRRGRSWAWHGTGHTKLFDDQVAWLAVAWAVCARISRVVMPRA